MLSFVRMKYILVIYILASDEDKARVTDPDNPYTDACVDGNGGAACSFCCIISKGECSRDIRACNPILVKDRHFENFYYMLAIILGVVCGCPLN